MPTACLSRRGRPDGRTRARRGRVVRLRPDPTLPTRSHSPFREWELGAAAHPVDIVILFFEPRVQFPLFPLFGDFISTACFAGPAGRRRRAAERANRPRPAAPSVCQQCASEGRMFLPCSRKCLHGCDTDPQRDWRKTARISAVFVVLLDRIELSASPLPRERPVSDRAAISAGCHTRGRGCVSGVPARRLRLGAAAGANAARQARIAASIFAGTRCA